MATVAEITDKALKLEPEERLEFLVELDEDTRAKVRAEITKRKGKGQEKEEVKEKPSESEDDLFQRMLRERGLRGSDGRGQKKLDWESVSTDEVDGIFSDLDSESSVSSFDSDSVKSFDYVGFNPKIIMQSLIAAGKGAGRSRDEMVKDFEVLAGIAHKKGSITSVNYGKLQPAGKAVYDGLAKVYGIQIGGSKGLSPEVVTIGRIGPTMPARILQLVVLGKLTAKKHPGACRSSSLPDTICSQALAPCIPTSLDSTVRDMILSLCEAYSIDQSCAIAKGKKPKAGDIWADQKQFVFTSYSSNYPSEATRIRVFKMIKWVDVVPKTRTCTAAYKKINDEVEEVDMKAVSDAISKL
jgi:hypothetical protein